MSLYVNGTMLSDTIDAVNVDGVNVTGVVCNGVTAWSKYAGPASPIIVTASTTMVAGIHFPAGKTITLCMCGGGGSGGKYYPDPDTHERAGSGGSRGATQSNINVGSFTSGANVVVTIGAGGAGRSSGSVYTGNAGGVTKFGQSGDAWYTTASGGAGGTSGGNASYLSPCTNTTFNGGGYLSGYFSVGRSYGGNGGTFGNGGSPTRQGNAGAGGVGAGGGGTGSFADAHASGAGGRGQIVISWVG